MLNLIKKLKARKHAPIIGYCDGYGGDMEGSYKATYLRKVNDETVEVCITNQTWHHAPVEIAEYEISADILKEINAIFDKYNLSGCPYQPKTNVFVCDAGTSNYEFEFEDGKTSRSYSDLIFTQKQNQGIRAVKELIKKRVEGVTPLPSFTPEPLKDGEMIEPIVPGEVKIKIIEYSRKRLRYSIINSLEQDLEIKETVILYRIDGDKKQEIYRDDDDSTGRVYAGYDHEESFGIKERLAAGKYLLVLDKYEKEFEIK